MATGLVLIAAAELALPLFAGQMIDALADSARSAMLPRWTRSRRSPRSSASALLWWSCAGPVQGIIRFTLRMMGDVARETFWRVQRFSTDWHANSFAGATVRS